ncbi:MAG TPA: SPOR domain-containing protein [Gallionella sp.]
MRNLFWILLLGNVILFAVMRGDGFGWGEQEVQAQPDLHGDMIRLIPAPQSAPARALPASKPVSEPIPVHTPVAVLTSSVPVSSPSESPAKPNSPMDVAAPAAAKPGTLVCLEWGDFSGPDLARATAALSALQLADKLSRRQIEQDIGYWVYFAPLRNKAAVNRKIAELKKLGIKEYFVVPGSGHWQNAISLGVFKTKEAAQNFLHDLNAKGVHTAQVGERASKLKSTIFMLDRVDTATVSKLTAMQSDFPGSALNNVPCALTR